MAISSAVEKEGTITLPKIIREKAHLKRGRRITIDIDEEGGCHHQTGRWCQNGKRSLERKRGDFRSDYQLKEILKE